MHLNHASQARFSTQRQQQPAPCTWLAGRPLESQGKRRRRRLPAGAPRPDALAALRVAPPAPRGCALRAAGPRNAPGGAASSLPRLHRTSRPPACPAMSEAGSTASAESNRQLARGPPLVSRNGRRRRRLSPFCRRLAAAHRTRVQRATMMLLPGHRALDDRGEGVYRERGCSGVLGGTGERIEAETASSQQARYESKARSWEVKTRRG